ncbi:hypothetical protein THTE_0216 [Thermogutta terrifontis]|uniref:Uncharacterized protein n=1 Tax=Thermogutta terrifontis TaxID=1331910 RepID=A0A286RA31_9BACT|nr:hypothetical protein THTE_0216 [Thermogutta terrifontis]
MNCPYDTVEPRHLTGFRESGDGSECGPCTMGRSPDKIKDEPWPSVPVDQQQRRRMAGFAAVCAIFVAVCARTDTGQKSCGSP